MERSQAPVMATAEAAVFGVAYQHLTLANGDELYLTRFGRPYRHVLRPDIFLSDQMWFLNHAESLEGTSCLYRIQSDVAGMNYPLDIVLKWNRMGQDVPGMFEDLNLFHVEFNSPFEEFAYVMELREATLRNRYRILTQRPLAIYMPAGHVALARLGRNAYKMKNLVSSHDDVALNMHRNYAVIYQWVKGMDAVAAFHAGLLTDDDLAQMTLRSREDMKINGFEVLDSKPHHLIVRRDGEDRLFRDRQGKVVYALIDFELLKHTDARKAEKRRDKRQVYLKKQARRFEDKPEEVMPPHLSRVKIMGVDYVYGKVAATKGRLWVVGKDPSLFDYFLPEKWRKTPRIKLSALDQLYQTTTEDNIHLVWRVSRVGEVPEMDPLRHEGERIIQHGYNSPFEEVALAVKLAKLGIPTTYPRAVYMASSKARMHDNIQDNQRYESHAVRATPDEQPILVRNHDYVIFWGYWNGPDELLAQRDESPFEGLDVLLAYRRGLLDKGMYVRLMDKIRGILWAVGIEDLNPLGNHILVSVDKAGQLISDEHGVPEIRLYNFEFLTHGQGWE